MKEVSVQPKTNLRILKSFTNRKKVGFFHIGSVMFQNGRWRNQGKVKGKTRKPLVGHPV